MKKGSSAIVIAAAILAAIALNAQQDKSKRPSPPGTASVSFADGKKITIDYSRPKVNDPKTGQPRKIFGGLVPYGQVWRAGANEATTFVTDADLMVGSLHVPAGSYTLFTVPNQNKWTLVVSKKTGEWGTPYPGEADDLGRTDMKVGSTSGPVDQFNITLDKTGDKAAVLYLDWENTRASVEIKEH